MTTVPLTKLFPLIVSVRSSLPATTEVGEKPEIVGTGLVCELILKVSALEIPPPGEGLMTETSAEPEAATSAAEIEAVRWDPET